MQIIMSQKVTYKCTQCGYEAVAYEGKGLFGQHITAVTCPDCHTIQNLVVGGGIGQVAPSFTTEVGRLCLRCGSNRSQVWDKRTGPKCGGLMKPTGESEFWT